MITAIVNPRASRRHADVAQAITSTAARARLLAADAEADVDALLLDADALAAQSLLVVVGGDGTVSNLLTRAAMHGVLQQLPPLLLLPVGELGTAARQLVGTGDAASLAERILVAWGRGVRRVVEMPVVQVRVEGSAARVGLTASLGAIARAHRDYARARIGGTVGIGEVLLRFGTASLPDERFSPIGDGLRCEDASGRTWMHQRATAALFAPLPGFFGWVRPFPGVRALATRDLHGLVSELGPFATRVSLPQLLRGARPSGRRLHGHGVQTASFTAGERPDVVALDGEVIAVAPSANVRIDATAPIRVVAWRPISRESATVA